MRITVSRLRRIIRDVIKESQFIFESENKFGGWFSDAKEKKIQAFLDNEEEEDYDDFPDFEEYEATQAMQNDDEYENFIKNLNNGGIEPIEWSQENKMPIGSHGFRKGTRLMGGHIDLRKSVVLDGVNYKVDIHFSRNPIASVLDKFLGEHYLDYHLYGLKFYAALRKIIENRYERYYSAVFDKSKLKEQVDVIIKVLQNRGFRLIATSEEEANRTAEYIKMRELDEEKVVDELKSYAVVWQKIKGNKEALHSLVWEIIEALEK